MRQEGFSFAGPGKDPYAHLGLPKGSSVEEVRNTYRKLAKELHPDLRPGDTDAAERFKRATAAFNLLTNADMKARFDRGEIDADGNPARPPSAGNARTYDPFEAARATAESVLRGTATPQANPTASDSQRPNDPQKDEDFLSSYDARLRRKRGY